MSCGRSKACSHDVGGKRVGKCALRLAIRNLAMSRASGSMSTYIYFSIFMPDNKADSSPAPIPAQSSTRVMPSAAAFLKKEEATTPWSSLPSAGSFELERLAAAFATAPGTDALILAFVSEHMDAIIVAVSWCCSSRVCSPSPASSDSGSWACHSPLFM
jgi:hypothetical protein